MTDPDHPGGAGPTGAGDLLNRVAIADEQSLPVDAASMDFLARRALAFLGARPGSELSLALVEPAAIAVLKGRFFGDEKPTDVLSFPMDGPAGPVIGDVIICPAVALRHARGLGRTLDEELALLLVHGILHLWGHEHDSPVDEIAMRAEERRILSGAAATV